MNTQIKTSNRTSLPLWFLVLLTAALIFAISQIGVSAYKKMQIKDPEVKAEISQIQSRKELLLLQPNVVNTNWLRTLNPLMKNVEGSIVWSGALQQGVVEFINLPKIKDNQYYQLWVHDLAEASNQASLVSVFKSPKDKELLMSFDTIKIKSPYKFELVLHTEGETTNQPLLLAQP
ncbi:anti-sigma factor [Cocleimonas sp. KMM 6892]|uniref:anti-sigma factor n=1 Tax=unclassified Cocleimonas TaxID=2639732 RepID=UPI002DBA420A|nr:MULTISPECIES: anti-sigma factor [unclassified Cocleimonas]MEB8432828.1 anti-sigma factor [Cocleimonas sp. KMM 6892]MEC4715687.1 anti-sigma factor [Cocleimonas sp. KMM 6895]MEC4744695.1 anti-sigma factor [Cocleimonas sp. KMM 6896]